MKLVDLELLLDLCARAIAAHKGERGPALLAYDNHFVVRASHVKSVVLELRGQRRWSSDPTILPTLSAPRKELSAVLADDGLWLAWTTGMIRLGCTYGVPSVPDGDLWEVAV